MTIPSRARAWLARQLEKLQKTVAPPLPPPAPESECDACANNTHPIGSPDHDARVLAFGGGGYDTVMQLGIVHALVVADVLPPDLVVGLSVGAINAAALAEVMKADDALRREGRRPGLCREARMSRFREFLYEAQETPGRLREMLLPDTYEADAGMALETHRLATHDESERQERQQAMRTRSGLVEFINKIARLRLTVATLTRYVRCVLGLRAATSEPFLDRWVQRGREWKRALRTLLAHVPSSLQAALAIVRASVLGRKRQRRGFPAGHILFRSTRRTRAAQIVVLATLIVLLAHWLFAPLVADFVDWLPFTSTSLVLSTQMLSVTLILILAWRVVPALFYLLLGVIGLLAYLVPVSHLRRALLRLVHDRFLAHYDLLRDLGGSYFVREALVRLFDPAYFGQRTITATARRVFRRVPRSAQPLATNPPERRTFQAYSNSKPKIHVVPVAASLRTGDLLPIGENVSVVDGLAAATAAAPFVAAVNIGEDYYIDGTSIANEPTTTVRQLLRDRVHPEATAVHLYTVSSLPIQANQVKPRQSRRYAGLIDVLLRVQQLRRFRNAKLDRDITALYDGALPPQRLPPERKPDRQIRALKCFGHSQHIVRTTVVPIEPSDHAITLSEELFRARNRQEQHEAIAETVAVGCRIAMETIMRHDIKGTATDGVAGCAAVVSGRRNTRLGEDAPGASEVCRRCTLTDAAGTNHAMALRSLPDGPPVWPLDPYLVPHAPVIAPTVAAPPEAEPPEDVVEPATVNLLFSGGVFRGVFLVGVVNALQVLRIRPQLVAGSSVGSITAAMAARMFTLPTPEEQRTHLGLVAATFLSLDHLIMTDRFADFVRRLTLRAAEAKFSLADIDDVLRNYDRPSNSRYFRSLRRLAGGLEHLLYVSPFELFALVRAMRLQNIRHAYRLARRYFQELLDRGAVGSELLGTEPLTFLIREHVLTRALRMQRTVPFDTFSEHGLSFLVTATNLTAGKLETIGAPDVNGIPREATLIDALLASSAFPGVFRPRWGWEVFVDENVEDQLVDGGVMDNLPLDAIVGHLSREAAARRLAVRPANDVPHLIFTASLERDPRQLTPRQLRRVAERWPATLQHARELRYNRKIDTFATAQRDFRSIYRRYQDHVVALPRVPLDIEVMVVKPRWLPGTFAFHPMLGFTRDRQAASIAHGCAATFAKVAEVDRMPDKQRWLDEWKFGGEVRRTLDHDRLSSLTPKRKTDGTCHFRSSGVCPFSPAGTGERLPTEVSDELHLIYRQCGERSTHRGAA